jgi:AcrR family transcriptional regulator
MSEADGLRGRILSAAWSALMEHGYAAASTAEIARRARVSKRDLYACFGSKQAILAALVGARAARMQAPLLNAPCNTRAELAEALTRFGTTLLHEASLPAVLALYRLAIAETERDPSVGLVLDAAGRDANRAALAKLLTGARERGLLTGEPEAMAGRFLALLWEDLFVRLLLDVAPPSDAPEIARRARDATEALLRLSG